TCEIPLAARWYPSAVPVIPAPTTTTAVRSINPRNLLEASVRLERRGQEDRPAERGRFLQASPGSSRRGAAGTYRWPPSSESTGKASIAPPDASLASRSSGEAQLPS